MNTQLIDSINHVYNTLGSGLSESVYHKALTLNLQQQFHIVEIEKSVPIIYMNHEITTFRADIVVDNQYVLELKAINTKLSEKDHNQIKRYMRILNVPKGILVNFGKNLEIIEI